MPNSRTNRTINVDLSELTIGYDNLFAPATYNTYTNTLMYGSTNMIRSIWDDKEYITKRETKTLIQSVPVGDVKKVACYLMPRYSFIDHNSLMNVSITYNYGEYYDFKYSKVTLHLKHHFDNKTGKYEFTEAKEYVEDSYFPKTETYVANDVEDITNTNLFQEVQLHEKRTPLLSNG